MRRCYGLKRLLYSRLRMGAPGFSLHPALAAAIEEKRGEKEFE